MIVIMHTPGTTDTTGTFAEDPSSPHPVPPRRKHGWVWRFAWIVAWATAVALFAIAALRIFYHDGSLTLTCINAFTRYVYLPIYVCLVWAAWQRRWALFLVGAAVAAVHFGLVSREFIRDDRFVGPPAPAGATTLRILFANVLSDLPNPPAYLEELSEINPDVIVFVEYYPWWHREARKTQAYAAYPYGTAGGQPAGGEIGVFSKLPIEHPQRFLAADRMCYSFDVQVDGQPLRIFALHAPRPMGDPWSDYYDYWGAVTPELLSLPDPAIVVGDFNATPYSRIYEILTEDHFRSAHDDRGRGYATTWPNGMVLLPPIRIDQALLTPSVECVSISEGRGLGSDHRPLILDVRLRVQ